jgi:hypothetical protein
LHFSNGEYYAGQAIDVTRRYVQHIKNHDDIVRISFMRVPPKKLNSVEQNTIHALESKGISLRNIAYTSYPRGDSDFDLVMTVKEQEKWLKEPGMAGDKTINRMVDNELRRKYRRRFALFQKEKYANQAIDDLRTYVQYCIPAARRGEVSFWAVSCLPQKNVYARINIYWQEVLRVGVDEEGLWFSFHLALSPFGKLTDKQWDKLINDYPLHISDHIWKPGGPDQFNILLFSQDNFQRFVRDPRILPAIRIFNLNLMKKGACNWGKNHCLDLADHLL